MNRLLVGVAVVVLLPLALWLAVELVPPAGALRATIQETLTGETPEAKIAAYVDAVRRADENAALAVWELPNWELPQGRSGNLRDRRLGLTRELIAAGIRTNYQIVQVEWWRTCCEPGVTTDPRSAGGARVVLQLSDKNQTPLTLRFDVFTRGGAYWGAAMGYPPREWVLRDVSLPDQEPLFWRFVYEPVIRSLDALPAR